MKKALKIAVIVVALLAALGTVWHFTVVDVTYRGTNAVKHFYSVYGADVADPAAKKESLLQELGNYDTYTLTTRKRLIAIWQLYGMALVGSYSQENYQAQKTYIEEHYRFADTGDTYLFKYTPTQNSVCEFDLNHWHFEMLNEVSAGTDLYEYYIPELFRMVAFNDTEQKIAFLTFGDNELDCFGENNDEADLQEFVKDSFRYNFEK